MEAQLLEAIAPSSISFLPSIIVTSEERASFVKEFKQRQTTYRARAAQFIEQSTKSDAQFIAFVHNVEDAWRNYIRLIEHADTLSPNLHNLYPEKTYLLSQLTEGMYTLNQHLYFITDVEKEIYERMFERIPPDRLETFLASIVSFPIYLSSNIASTEIEQTTPSAARALAQRNSYAGALLRSCGGSVELFQNALRDAGTLQRDVHHEQFIPENDVERALQTIVAYDHFVELFLRKSRLIELDIAFYAMLARRLNVLPQHNDIINALEQLKTKQGREFSYPIPGYSQSALSCGVAGLAVIWNLLGLLLLLATEGRSPSVGMHDVLFEQVSAFGTVGLSTGLTPKLSVAGKLWIIATMFVGRLGPLTLAVWAFTRKAPGVRYPEGRIMIG